MWRMNNMNIYFVRHGEDDEKYRGGWSELPLVQLGIDKANKLGVLNGNIAYATGKRKRSVAKVCCKYKDGINLEINEKFI